MTRSNEPKTAPLLQNQAELDRNALRITWVVIAASALATMFCTYLAFRGNTWQLYALAGISASLLLACWISSILIRKGHPRGIWILILWGQAAFTASSVLFTGLGLISLASILGLTILVAPQTLPLKQVRWAIYLGLTFSVLAGFADRLKPAFQVAPPPEARYFLPILVAILFAFLAFLFARNLRNFSLRAQLISTFLLVSSLSVITVTLFSILYLQRTLTNDKNEQLYEAASRTAHLIDEFFISNLNAISAERQLPELIEFMSLSSDQRLGSREEARATNILYLLAQKDPQNIASYALLDVEGTDIIDTNRLEIGENRSTQDYFSKVVETGESFASRVEFSINFVAPIIHFCAPIQGETGNILGVLCARYLISSISHMIEANSGLVGQGSYAFVVDENHIRLAHGVDPTLAFKSVVPFGEAALLKLKNENRLPDVAAEKISTDLPGLEQALNNSDVNPFYTGELGRSSDVTGSNASVEQAAIASLQNHPWKVIYAINRGAFLAPIEAQTRRTAVLALAIATLAALGGLWMAQILTAPITQLTGVAKRITGGDLSAQAPVDSRHELGTLAEAFNAMTSQLRLTLAGLEERVAERTNQLERRALQLRASAEVGSAIASIRILDDLLPKITSLISQRFGFYHVGIFLIDPVGEYAILRAANSEGGERMLARNHRLKVGEEGIVGFVTSQKEPRIAMDVGKDAVFFNNPDLPETRSEMALPLMAGDQVLGALDVQSTEPGAFTQEDIATLQLLADQVTIAIENARLFSENQSALEAIRRAYGELSREAWTKMIHNRSNYGVIADKYDILYDPVDTWPAEMVQAANTNDTVYAGDGIVAIPIRERDHVLGIVRLRKLDSEMWSKEELSLAETLAQQLYLALENARLYQETQRRAERERLASEITAKMRVSNDPQVILQTAVEELRRALNVQSGQVVSQPAPLPVESAPGNGGNPSRLAK